MTGKVWTYITEKLESEGALHFSLIDPDPMQITPEVAGRMAKFAEAAGSDAIMIGGSTAFLIIEEATKTISEQVDIPTILFPGSLSGVCGYADAIFFMSLFNSRNPYHIVGVQALAAANIKMQEIEPISMAYLIIDPGKTAAWVGDAKPFPRDKPKLPVAYAMAAEMFGFKLVYLEAGSGAEGGGVPPEMISMVSQFVDIPVITGGGFNDAESVKNAVEAGASIVVQGTYLEKNMGEKEIDGLANIVSALKKAGAKKV